MRFYRILPFAKSRHHWWKCFWNLSQLGELWKLDVLMARQHLMSPQSLSSRSLLQQIPYLTLKIQRSKSWPRSNLMFAFHFMALDHLWLRYIKKVHIWLWKFKVKVMAKVKPNGHIWGLEFNRCVCFLFRGNWTIIGWDTSNSIFDLENARSMSWKSQGHG